MSDKKAKIVWDTISVIKNEFSNQLKTVIKDEETCKR